MSAELVTMLAVGAALAGLVLVQTGAVRADLRRQGATAWTRSPSEWRASKA